MENVTGTELALRLDPATLEALEDFAATQRCSLEEAALLQLKKLLRTDSKPKSRARPTSQAPLDAFLPEGADPFQEVRLADEELPVSFAEIQARLRFAGTPSLLRDRDSSL